MGMQLCFEVFDFFLNAGVTLATFKSDEKIEFSILNLCLHENI